LARRLVVAGAALWFVRWLAAPPARVPEPALEPAPEAKPARDDWEFPRPRLARARRKSLRRRFATSLAFTVIFFAGAALAAGAGNELANANQDASTVATDAAATTSDGATAPATTDAAPASPEQTGQTDPSAASSDAASSDAAPASTAAPATPPAPAAAPDPAPAPPAAVTPTDAAPPSPAPTAGDTTPAPTTDTAPADTTTTATTPDDIPTAVAAGSEPAAVPVPASTPEATLRPRSHTKRRPAPRRSTDAKHTAARHLQNLPLVVPYHAIVFNPQQWLNDNPGTPTGQAAVAIAMNYLGVPYRWGGAVPATGFDCSGLTRFVYAQLGINLVHYAATQFASFPKLDPTQLAPGDLVFFEPKADGPGHVAMYIGHDQIIEAPHTGAVVRIGSFSGEAAALGFLGAVRPYAAAPAPNLALMSAVAWGPASSLLRVQ
jgi:cell wall-associated NlpC family hydrolase